MAAGPLSIRLRCSSWQQLATIYGRDLSRGTMFLKASSQPPIGTAIRIDLELPSQTVVELTGHIAQHVVDPQRGTGVEIGLDALPTKTVWLIESALAAETTMRGERMTPPPPASPADLDSGSEITEAEDQLVSALASEAESLRRMNPFLVLGLAQDAGDGDVRAAFGELTKRYHPDRYARYQSTRLRQLAAEIFILIRDAYRKLADEPARAQVRAQLSGAKPRPKTAPVVPRIPPLVRDSQGAPIPPAGRPPSPVPASVYDAPTPMRPTVPLPPQPTQYDAPTNPSDKSAAIASTQIARPEDLAAPAQHIIDRKSGPVPRVSNDGVPAPIANQKSEPVRKPQSPTALLSPSQAIPLVEDLAVELEALIEQGRLDEALAACRNVLRKNAQDPAARAGVELVEGLRALAQRDRLEAAQRFEAALELDPSNERAARELADMRRQATNERKGLLSRLMGKKEGPP